jgi:hypothetical protein
VSREHRLRFLASVTVAVCTVIFVQEPIPQDPCYHEFADQRGFLGLPHALNVATNLFFLLVGAIGLVRIFCWSRGEGTAFENPVEAIPYAALCIGLILTGFGSAYYHIAPDTDRLFWDRLPMSIAFMAYLVTAITERIDRRTGVGAVFPLIAYGVFSVLYWRLTEQSGSGDLRYYLLAQLMPLILVPLMVWLLPSPYTRGRDLFVVTGLYMLAKALEIADAFVYDLGRIISGHSLKHIAAAGAALWILRMLQKRAPAPTNEGQQLP